LNHCGTGSPSGAAIKSRKCPECLGTAEWTPKADDEIGMTQEDGALVQQYAGAAKAGDPVAFGKLGALLGPEVAARLTSGEQISAQEFQRAYLAAARASQSSAPGQDHVVTAADFRRGPLGCRPVAARPGSTWPGQGGQQDYYGGGAGVGQERGPWPTPGLAASTRIGV
jgi:hypothetical protein